MNQTKHIYVLLDKDGDIVETFPENSVIDWMFEVRRIDCPHGNIYKATIQIEEAVIE